MGEYLTTETRDNIAVLTMRNSEKSNALSLALRAALAEAFAQLATREDVKAIVLTGEGERSFSAGLDLSEMREGNDLVSSGSDPVAAIAQSPVPVIAAVNGAAITGGFELTLACDIIAASENAFFIDSHARMGVVPGWGLSQRLSRRVGMSRALQISLTGQPVTAQSALAIGLVNSVHAPDDLMPGARRLAADIAQWDRSFVAAYRRLITEGAGMPLAEALTLEAQVSRQHNASLNPVALGQRGLTPGLKQEGKE